MRTLFPPLAVGDRVGDFEVTEIRAGEPPRYHRRVDLRCTRCGCIKVGLRSDNLRASSYRCRWRAGDPKAHRGRPPRERHP